MKIRYLDGERIYRAFLAGGNAVISDKDYLNKINVFPVPDADTGTNLASTMQSIARGAVASRSLRTTLSSIADAALEGARGNSGLIFAQFIYGISKEIGSDVRISTRHFGESVRRAVRYAYQSLLHPTEGTMLTLINDWSESVYELRLKFSDFAELLSYSLQTARESLRDTPKKLSVLAKAGVVDAGAKGFVDFLEGVVNFIRKGNIKAMGPTSVPALETDSSRHSFRNPAEHRYCAEALITGKSMDPGVIREELRPLGSSAIVAGAGDKIRIHIHTDSPTRLFERLRTHGTIRQIKVDDMQRQYEACHAPKARIALVTDSTCDLPQAFLDEHQIHVIPFSLTFGEDLFLDKLTITPDPFYSLLEKTREHPKSAQPSQASVENLFSFLSSHYDSIIAVIISGRLTGLYNQCRLASEKMAETKITVIDSKHLSVTLGLIVARVARAIREGMPHEMVAELARRWTRQTEILVDINTLEYMVRGGRVSRAKGFLARLLNLKPIVALDDEGKAVAFGKSFSRRSNMKKILGVVQEHARSRRIHSYSIVHAKNPERARAYSARLEGMLGMPPAHILELSPVVGVHNGIGAIGIGVTYCDEDRPQAGIGLP